MLTKTTQIVLSVITIGIGSLIFALSSKSTDKEFVLYNMRGYVNVKSYGAIGDGKADDTSAFISALEHGGKIFVPEGTYVINKQINVNTDFELLGAGREKSKVVFSDRIIDVFDDYLFRVDCHSFSISKMSLSYSTKHVKHFASAEKIFIKIQNCKESGIISDCDISIEAIGNTTISMTNIWLRPTECAQNVIIENNTIVNKGYSNIGGVVWMRNDSSSYMDNISICNNEIVHTGADEAICLWSQDTDITGIERVKITGNDIKGYNDVISSANVIAINNSGGYENTEISCNNISVCGKASNLIKLHDACSFKNNTVDFVSQEENEHVFCDYIIAIKGPKIEISQNEISANTTATVRFVFSNETAIMNNNFWVRAYDLWFSNKYQEEESDVCFENNRFDIMVSKNGKNYSKMDGTSTIPLVFWGSVTFRDNVFENSCPFYINTSTEKCSLSFLNNRFDHFYICIQRKVDDFVFLGNTVKGNVEIANCSSPFSYFSLDANEYDELELTKDWVPVKRNSTTFSKRWITQE